MFCWWCNSKVLTKTMCIRMTIDINGNIISDSTIMLGGIIWRDMRVSSSDFWYIHTWNTAIIAILDRKLFWTYQSSNLDIIVSVNWINSYFTSHVWHLNLDVHSIIIGLGIMEFCDSCICDLGTLVWSITSSGPVSSFLPLAILFLFLRFWIVPDYF